KMAPYLEKDKTYLFELVHPENRIVIEFRQPALYFLGSRSNQDGDESYSFPFPADFRIRKPAKIHLNVQHAINIVNEKDFDWEGCVVMDEDFNRVKVISSKYLEAKKQKVEEE
ncbi:MAG: hypothetical protein GY940_05295, partial [bacterium]|nr:hypothetical protein [bacterium]